MSLETATMALGKQAKSLSKTQIDVALGYLAASRHPIRNRTILLLSVKAGMRAKEIACLSWDMLTTAEGEIGNAIHRHFPDGRSIRPRWRKDRAA